MVWPGVTVKWKTKSVIIIIIISNKLLISNVHVIHTEHEHCFYYPQH